MSEQVQPPYGQQPYGGPGGVPPNHKDAVTSLVLGIVSVLLCGLLTGIPAIILGRRARREIRAANGQLGGDGLATAGLVTGLIGTILSGLALLLVVGVFALGGVVSNTFEHTCSTVSTSGNSSTPC